MNLTIPEEFKPFDWQGDSWNYERNLPHWRKPGVTYFVTFRLNDSLPREAVEQAQREREAWEQRILEHHNLLPESLQEDYTAWLRHTWRKMEAVMDACHGACILRQPDIRKIVADALLFFEGLRSSMHGFVIMPNHIHLAVVALGDYQIEELLKSWKGFSSREINKALGRKGQLWQEDSWNRIIRDEQHWMRVMRYILKNPEKAKLHDGEFTLWQAARTLHVERVFQPVLREAPSPSPRPQDEPW